MRNITRYFLFTVLAVTGTLGVFANDASAKKKIGKSFIGINEIIIFDDYTWNYLDKENKNECDDITHGFLFCGESANFKPEDGLNEDAIAAYRIDDRNYAMIIVEEVGQNQGASNEFMINSIIKTAADAAGKNVEDVRKLNIEDDYLLEEQIKTVTYGLNYEGIDVVYTNSILVMDEYSFQFVTFSIEKLPHRRA